MKLRIAANVVLLLNTLVLAPQPAHAEKTNTPLSINQLQLQGSKPL